MMDARTAILAEDRYITVDGLNIRYIERGEGPAAIFMHGASLGSSADVFQRNLGPLAEAGIRAIAYDHPGFGLSDNPTDFSVAARRDMTPKLIDALGLGRATLIPHSQSGGMAVQLVLEAPDRYSHLIAIGTGGLLPPLEGAGEDPGTPPQERAGQPATEDEPSLEFARQQLVATTFDTALVTEEEVASRHARSIGKNFEAHIARAKAGGTGAPATPIWQRLAGIEIPFVLLIGREDRANAFERAELLRRRYPELDIRIAANCKHMVPWDAAEEVAKVAISTILS